MGNLSCGQQCTRFLLLVSNFILWALGILIMGMGLWGMFANKNIKNELEPQYDDTFIGGIIGLGAFLLVVGFLGCCGACVKNRCMLNSYAVILIILLGMQVIFGIIVGMGQAKILAHYEDELNSTMLEYRSNENSKAEWDSLQQDLSCCGLIDGPSSWQTIFDGRTEVPDSCCRNMTDGCGKDIDSFSDESIFSEDCYKKAKSDFEMHLIYLGLIAGGICGFELLAIIAACCLSRAVDESSTSYA